VDRGRLKKTPAFRLQIFHVRRFLVAGERTGVRFAVSRGNLCQSNVLGDKNGKWLVVFWRTTDLMNNITKRRGSSYTENFGICVIRAFGVACLGVRLFLAKSLADATPQDTTALNSTMMSKIQVYASDLDLDADERIDQLDVASRSIVYDVGNRVPAGNILAALTREQLEAEYRPSYPSIEEFVAGVRHSGWSVVEERELKDFYLAVMKTRSGHVVGVYHAKSREGVDFQRSGKIQLFIADQSDRQIIPDSEVFALCQKVTYIAATTNIGATGLIPMDHAPGTIQCGVSAVSGAISVPEGRLFFMPRSLDDFHLIFRVGAESSDSAEIEFRGWHSRPGGKAQQGLVWN
jgi:hypothetical protein